MESQKKDENNKILKHPSSQSSPHSTKNEMMDGLSMIEKERIQINSFAKSGPGLKTSIQTAAFLSIAMPLLCAIVVSYFPPAKHFVSAFINKGKIEYSIKTKSSKAKLFRITSRKNDLDTIIVNFDYGSCAILDFEIVAPKDKFIGVNPIGKRYPDEYSEASDKNFPEMKPYRAAFQFTNIPKNIPVDVIFYFINSNGSFKVDNIVKDNSILVDKNDTGYFIFPNTIYTVFLIIALGIIFWLFSVYFRIYKTASNLENILELINIELVDKRSSSKQDWEGIALKDFFAYCDEIIRRNPRYSSFNLQRSEERRVGKECRL